MPTSSTGKAASQSGWEIHKETLRKLYLVEKKTLEEVKELMDKSYNFKATESQYEHVFRQWGFEKNLKKSDWAAIDHHTYKRKRDGKESEVLHNSVIVPSKKIRKEILRNRRMVSPRREGAQSPPLPNSVTIRTPVAIHMVLAEASESSTLSAAEDNTKFAVTAQFSSPSVSNHSSNQISKSTDRDLLAESYDLRVDDESGSGLPGFALLDNLEDFQTNDIIHQEWSPSHTRASEIFRTTFNTTPTTRQDHVSVSNWSGSHLEVLHNIPWFQFQQMILSGSFGSRSGIGYALQSPTDGFGFPLPSFSPIQYSLAIDERQRLLSGFFSSTSVLNDLEIHSHFTSLLQDLVPERFDGEISNKIRYFFDPSNKNSLYQLAEFYLYLLSNNKFTEAQADSFLKWITQQKPVGLLKALFQVKAPTARVFSDKILEFSVKRGNAINLRFLIDCGLDESSLSGVEGGKYLQMALAYHQSDIAGLILENKVDVNPPLGKFPYDQPPLYKAVGSGYSNVVRRLIDAGAHLHKKLPVDDLGADTALANGIYYLKWRNEPADCIQMLLKAGADVDDGKIDGIPSLDWIYLNDLKSYHMILPSSQVAKRFLTVSGILYAADNGRQALSQYLNKIHPIEDWQRRNKLEKALCHAVNYSKPIEVVSILLEFGVDPNIVTICPFEELRPLYSAAEANNIDLAEILIDAGADFNTPEVLGAAAERDNNYDILNFLIGKGADIKTFGEVALRGADFRNNFAIVKLLLGSGVDINYKVLYKGGKTLLQEAIWVGNLKTIKYLINQGADINAPPSHSDGFTALQAAAFQGSMEIVTLLLTSGAEINSAPSRSLGRTVLEASAGCKLSSERAELFRFLSDQGANINRQKKHRNYRNWDSALTTLVKNSAGHELIRFALSTGADVNEPGNGKGARTPVQAAAEVGDIAIVQLLLNNGANINAPPGADYGRTALQAACSIGSPKIEPVKLLLDNGADVNIPAGIKQGLTAFQGAAIQGHIKIALMLLDAGAEVNADPAAINGRSALDGAAEHGRLDMVHLLLDCGAESERPGATGFDRAIELAKVHGHSAVADLLKNRSSKG